MWMAMTVSKRAAERSMTFHLAYAVTLEGDTFPADLVPVWLQQ